MKPTIAFALTAFFLCAGCAEKGKGEQRIDEFIQTTKTDALFDRVGRLESNMARDYATMVEPGDASWMDADELRLAIRWNSLSQSKNGALASVDVGNLLSMDARDCIVDFIYGSTDKDGRFIRTSTAMVKIPELTSGRYVRMQVNLSGFSSDQVGRITVRHVTCIGQLGPS